MAEQIVKVKIDLDVTEFNKNAKAMSAALSSVLGRDVEIFNGKIAKTKQLVEQTEKAMGGAANAMKGTGDAVKKTNQQYTNLALVLQDLPFGFRGIQNNLPALIGGMAGVTGGMYLATSAIIALFTAWDMGAFGAMKSTDEWRKSLKETNDEIKRTLNYTTSEVSNLRGLVDVMLDVNTTESIRNKALLEAKEAITQVDEAQGKKIKTIGDAIVAINLYSEAIQQQQMQEVIGKKIAEISIGQIEKRNKLAIETAKANKGIHPINFFMGDSELQGLQSEVIANETFLRQLEDLRKTNTKALLLNPFSKFNAKGGGKSGAIKQDTSDLDRLKKQQNTFKDEIDMFYYYGKLIIKEEERLSLDRAVLEKKSNTEIKNIRLGFEADMLVNQQEYGRAIMASADKTTKEYEKNEEEVNKIILKNKEDLTDALSKINDDFAKTEIKDRNAQLSATLKATKGNYEAQKAAIRSAISDNEQFRQSAIDAGVGTKLFDDNITNLKASLEGLIDPIEQFELDFNNLINGLISGVLVELGTQIGNLFSGEGFSMDGFLNLIADAMIKLGTYLVSMSKLFIAVKALFASGGVLAPFMIPIGIAAIASGVALKSSLSKTKKFANGGIISGPTMGLMGEYPGAQSNPEVVAPLDKLKDMIGGGGGGGRFVLRGQDLLLSVNRAQKASNLKGQNISLA